jgi:exodeoxyribonuclease VII large subunit
MNQISLNLAPERRVWSVSEITSRICGLLESEFSDVWLEGEVSNYIASQPGHLYFTLKDARAQIRCICFRDSARRLKFRPEPGMHMLVRGALGVFEPRGEYQLQVSYIEPVGHGALQAAFEQLKGRLAAEGLFDEARKKAIPVLPRRIGLVTSPTGAAVSDILRVLARRFPNVSLLIFPVRVQGEGAAAEIVTAIRYFNRVRGVDVIILARGGGSIEDLWPFNEEIVARAIAAGEIPLITGIGHETDFTIADFAGDLRAPTPSAAAEIVVRQRNEFESHIRRQEQQIQERMRYRIAILERRLHELRGRKAFRRPLEILRGGEQRLDVLQSEMVEGFRVRLRLSQRRLRTAQTQLLRFDLRQRVGVLRARILALMGAIAAALERSAARRRKALGKLQLRLAAMDLRARLGRHRRRLESAANALQSVAARKLVARRRQFEALEIRLQERSPFGLLERGYAIAYDSAGRVLRSPDQVSAGDEIAVQLARGQVDASVLRKKKIGP